MNEEDLDVRTELLVKEINELKRKISRISDIIKDELVTEVNSVKRRIEDNERVIGEIDEKISNLKSLVNNVVLDATETRRHLILETERIAKFLSEINMETLNNCNDRLSGLEDKLSYVSSKSPPSMVPGEVNKRTSSLKSFRRDIEKEFQRRDKEILELRTVLTTLTNDYKMWKIELDSTCKRVQSTLERNRAEEDRLLEEVMRRLHLLGK